MLHANRNSFVLVIGITQAVWGEPPLPVGTAFTYQGRLTQGGQPVDEPVDFSFALFGQEAGGIALGWQTLSNTPVYDGLFTAVLNALGEFGPAAFNGEARWLEISINGGSPLSPRQPMTATPFAFHALSAPQGHALDASSGGPANALFVDPVGRVGIATLTPESRLEVQGGIRARGGVPGGLGANDNGYAFRGNGGDNDSGMFSSADGQLEFYTDNIERMRVNDSGYVGIGTSSPNRPLTIQGVGAASDWLQLRNSAGANKWHLSSLSGGVSFSETGIADGRLFLAGGGNVGIGTTSPNRPLTIRGVGAASDWLQLRNSAGADKWHLSSVGGGLNFAETAVADGRLYLATGGKVGMGTQTPEAGLHVVHQPNTAQGTLALQGATHTFMSFYPDGPGTRKAWFGFGDADANDITIHNQVTGGNIVLAAGPGGATRVNILEITGGSDVAEPYSIASTAGIAPEPGMVVSIDAANPGRLCVSNRAHDPGVAGIISGANGIQPGLVLRQKGTVADGEHPVASFGRVWCWVDADAAGPITPGDLLTTSECPGHAMRVADPSRSQGAVIGKAMSALTEGKGLVLVLVSLQ